MSDIDYEGKPFTLGLAAPFPQVNVSIKGLGIRLVSCSSPFITFVQQNGKTFPLLPGQGFKSDQLVQIKQLIGSVAGDIVTVAYGDILVAGGAQGTALAGPGGTAIIAGSATAGTLASAAAVLPPQKITNTGVNEQQAPWAANAFFTSGVLTPIAALNLNFSPSTTTATLRRARLDVNLSATLASTLSIQAYLVRAAALVGGTFNTATLQGFMPGNSFLACVCQGITGAGSPATLTTPQLLMATTVFQGGSLANQQGASVIDLTFPPDQWGQPLQVSAAFPILALCLKFSGVPAGLNFAYTSMFQWEESAYGV